MLDTILPRVQKLLLTPKAAWAEIDGEPVDVQALYKSYIIPLAAAAQVAGFIGLFLVGISYLGTTHRISLVTGLTQLVVGLALNLAMIYVFAKIIDWLAPKFGAQQNFAQAFKVAAYAPTAGWIGGLFLILPALSLVSLIGSIYSLYLLFLGLPMLMKPAEDKKVIYVLAAIGCAIVIGIAAAALTSILFPFAGAYQL